MLPKKTRNRKITHLRDRVCLRCSKQFKQRHDRPGKYCSMSCYADGPNNINWKGDAVSYQGIHIWVRAHKPKGTSCETCGVTGVTLDCANISGEYKRDINDYKHLCRRCHMNEDGRMKNLHYGKKK